ncbi:hypothetical protein EDB84DRAFT_1572488 [Lactarius hengduanensis]|nr:hypothetical protein EDB84DRAFT_1572488 [Lactarius hengduanensis]
MKRHQVRDHRLRESNFAATAASDREGAPLMVSQRGLFAFIPGVRSEAARAAASTPTPPKECAMYLLQEAAPQLAHDHAPGRAKPSQRPQAPAPVVEARMSTTPSARCNIAQQCAQHSRAPPVSAPSPANPSCDPKSAANGRNVVPPTAPFHPHAISIQSARATSRTAVEPSSDKQSAMCRHTIAPRPLFHARKPPDVIRQASTLPTARPVMRLTKLTGDSQFFSEEENWALPLCVN